MKNSYNSKVLLCSCDGVLLDWEHAFDTWMLRHGYRIKVPGEFHVRIKYGLELSEANLVVMRFNESAWIQKLSPYKDAIKYIRKLHEELGYVIHLISSLTTDEFSRRLRTENLKELFGLSVFERYIYLDCGEDKTRAIKQYAGTHCFYVDDNIANLEYGAMQQLRPIIMKHNQNSSYLGTFPHIDNWKEIYEILIENIAI